MFQKLKTKKKIKKIIKGIQALEQKRTRSQAGLVEAILTNTAPNDEDVDFFNRYTEKINELRAELAIAKKELN